MHFILLLLIALAPATCLSPNVILQRTSDSELLQTFIRHADALPGAQKTQHLARISRLQNEHVDNDGIEAAIDLVSDDLQIHDATAATILPTLARIASRHERCRQRVLEILSPFPPSHARSAALAAASNEPVYFSNDISFYKSLMTPPSVDELMLVMDCLIESRQMRRTSSNSSTSSSSTSYTERRGTAWLGDPDAVPNWCYGNLASPLTAEPFPPLVETLRLRLNDLLSSNYDCCLVNYYSDTDVGMKWHSDPDQIVNSERPLFTTDTAVISVGEPASLKFRPLKQSSSSPSINRFELFCCDGDVVRMTNDCQAVFEHAVEGTGERFSLVFKET